MLATSCLPIAHSNIIDNFFNVGFYVGLTEFLTLKYPQEPKLVQCIINFFKRFEIEKEFVNFKSLINFQEAGDDMMDYVNYAEVACRVEAFFKTPIGFLIAVLLLISVIASFIKCCSRMNNY